MSIFSFFWRSKSRARQFRRYDSPQFKKRIQTVRNQQRQISRQFKTNKELPFFSKFKTKAVILLSIVVLGVLFYFFIMSDYFVVKNIEISGNYKFDQNKAQDILRDDGNKRVILIKKANNLILSKKSLLKIFSARTPYVKEIVSMKKVWPDSLKIEIVERAPEFLLKSGENYYLADSDGLIVENFSEPIEGFYLVENLIEEQFELLEPFPNQKLSAFIISAHRNWNSKIAVPIKAIKIPGKASSEAHFETSESWTVFFDVNSAVNQQLSSLAILLQKQISQAQRKNLIYIDLRSSKYAYICYKNSACDKTAQPVEEAKNVQK
jgi:cell division septal protein FtsQ